MAKKRYSKIGGQAVIEGVMMKGERSIATAVRDESGKIVVESKYITPVSEKSKVYRIPFIRGVFNFFGTMAMGMSTLMRSGEVFGGDEEPGKVEKWFANKLKINLFDVMMVFSVILGIALALGIFFLLPWGIILGVKALVKMGLGSEANATWYASVLYALLEGVIRIIIFILYIKFTTLIKTVNRTYMYHGAEHKTISAYENELELTVENVQKMSTLHDRCGTTFMFIIMLVSVLVFSIVGIFEPYLNSLGMWKQIILLASRIVLLPLIMGISYEMLKSMAKYDNWFVRILKFPGLALQRLTTKEPTDDMVECAITAFNTVMQMDADPTTPEQRFDTKKPYQKVRADVENMLKKADKSDIDWIFAEVLNVKRSQLCDVDTVNQIEYEKIMDFAKKRQSGMPLWRVFGYVDFYGYNIKVNENVLCPRPETEELVENVLKVTKSGDRVLDMCTGSGCIAIVVAKKANCNVVGVDYSQKALELAKQNAQANEVENIEFVESDMFEKVQGKYDIIVSNPPYIKTKDIHKLDKEVRDYDPHMALDGGSDGLDFYRIFAEKSAEYLNDKGYLILECGQGQGQEIVKLLGSNFDSQVINDMQGVDRIVFARKK